MEMVEDIVVLDRRESQRLETEQLLYDAARDRLSSDVDFVLYRRNTVVRGTGFISDPGLDTVEVVQPSGVSEGMAAPGVATPSSGEADRDSAAAGEGDRGGASDTTTVAPPDNTVVPDSTTVVPPDSTTAAEADSMVPSQADSTSAPDTTASRQSVR
jgi:hypothetical protein